MRELLGRFIRDEDGQDLIEYAFLVVFIAILTMAILNGASGAINSVFQSIIDQLNGA